MFNSIRLKTWGPSLILLFPLALLPNPIMLALPSKHTQFSPLPCHLWPSTSVSFTWVIPKSFLFSHCFLFGRQSDPMKTYTQIMSSPVQNSPKGLPFSQRSQPAPGSLQGPDLPSLGLGVSCHHSQQPPQPPRAPVNKPGRAWLTAPVLPVPTSPRHLHRPSPSPSTLSSNITFLIGLHFLYKKVPKN